MRHQAVAHRLCDCLTADGGPQACAATADCVSTERAMVVLVLMFSLLVTTQLVVGPGIQDRYASLAGLCPGDAVEQQVLEDSLERVIEDLLEDFFREEDLKDLLQRDPMHKTFC